MTKPAPAPVVSLPPEVNRQRRGHDFYPPATVLAALPALYATEETPCADKVLHLHFFSSWGDWYVTEFNPADGEVFGWAQIGNAEVGEWGYSDLPALESFEPRGIGGLVERDLHFEPVTFHELMRPRWNLTVDMRNPARPVVHKASCRCPERYDLAVPLARNLVQLHGGIDDAAARVFAREMAQDPALTAAALAQRFDVRPCLS